MSYVTAADGVRLYFEERGDGTPIVFVHEFSGTCRSFDLQVEAFGPRHRCIAFNARGYPPSEVPESVDAYSQDIAAGDVAAVLDGLEIAPAHLVGVSMGAAAALQFALRHPSRALSATLVGVGSGSDADPEQHRATTESTAALIDSSGMAGLAGTMGDSPARRKLKHKNPAEFRRFVEQLAALSPVGAANTMRGVQKRRAPIYAHANRLARLRVPVLIVVGEDDAGCRKPSEFLARTLPDARLEVIPGTGHVVNIEEPAVFNRMCSAFIDRVDAASRASA